jgi:hypothetical protein
MLDNAPSAIRAAATLIAPGVRRDQVSSLDTRPGAGRCVDSGAARSATCG